MSDAPASAASSGEVITFYSYKGGTGRSMLLANVAWMLASAGRKVLVIDWDLEAPGLHRYFKPFLGDDPELHEQEGVIEWLQDYWDAMLEQGEHADIDAVVREYADPRRYVRRLATDSYLAGGIDLLGSGRQDRGYAEAVADFDFTRLYHKLRGADFIEAAKRILVGSGGYDYVLVDSRTGVSDTSGFCTVGLADTLVVCFTYNNQSLIGASNIARDIKRQAESQRAARVADGTARRFRVFAVPSRVDDLDPERLERRQRQAWGAFADLLTDVPKEQQTSYWLAVQIRNQGLFAYEEVLAVCMNRPTDPQSVLGSVTMLTRFLTDQSFANPPAMDDERRRTLREMFATQSAGVMPLLTSHSAWEQFCTNVNESGARDAVLEASFALLVQLYAPAAALMAAAPDGREPTLVELIVRTSLLEYELTNDERRLAEMLTSVGVVERRISDDRQRALTVADQSIFEHWQPLRLRLNELLPFLIEREQVRQARRSWEASGRSISTLRSLQREFNEPTVSTEQGAWFGRPNLQFLDAMREIRMAEERTRVNELRVAALEARRNEQEREYSARLDDFSAQSRVSAERGERRLWGTWLVGAAVAVAGILTAILLLQRAEHARAGAAGERTRAIEEKAIAESGRAAAEAKLEEVERARAAERAKVLYGEASNIAAQARNGRYDAAIEAYGKVIAADPNYAEAYRGRARARARATDKDAAAELADWATYYDLRPSLNGRSLTIERALKVDPVDTKLVAAQLAKLRDDAANVGSRDASPRLVAARLEQVYEQFPTALQRGARAAIEALRASQDTTPDRARLVPPPPQKAATK